MKQEEIDYNPVPPKASYPVYCFTDEALAKFKAKVRRDALLEAEKAMCPFCKHDFEVEFKAQLGYVHLNKEGRVFTDCKSFLIRELIAADQGQGGERS